MTTRVSRLNPRQTTADIQLLAATNTSAGTVLLAGDLAGNAASPQIAGLLDRAVTIAICETATALDVGEGFTTAPRDLKDPLLGGTTAAFTVLGISVIADQACTWTLTKSNAADGITGGVTVDTQTFNSGGGTTWREYVVRDARYVTVAVDCGSTPLGNLELITVRRGVATA